MNKRSSLGIQKEDSELQFVSPSHNLEQFWNTAKRSYKLSIKMRRKLVFLLRSVRRSPNKIFKSVMEEQYCQDEVNRLSHINVNWRFFNGKANTSKTRYSTHTCVPALRYTFTASKHRSDGQVDGSVEMENSKDDTEIKKSCCLHYSESDRSSSFDSITSTSSTISSIFTKGSTGGSFDDMCLKLNELDEICISDESHFFIDNCSTSTKHGYCEPQKQSNVLSPNSNNSKYESSQKKCKNNWTESAEKPNLAMVQLISKNFRASRIPWNIPKVEKSNVAKGLFKPFTDMKRIRSLSESLILNDVGIYASCVRY